MKYLTKLSMINSKILNLSIVIPTLGEDVLNDCLASIFNSSIMPTEIIIVIPKKFSNINNTLASNNYIKIIYSEDMGQVNQKIIGFKAAKCKYVMQLDSDIILHKNTIKNLHDSLIKFTNPAAVAPFISNGSNTLYTKNRSYLFNLLRNIIINKTTYHKPGIINYFGYNTWFEDYIPKLLTTVEWLPGGCIIFEAKSLIKYNYFPFKGKAYCEDVFHSLELSNNGVHLLFDPNSYVTNKGSDIEKKTIKSIAKEFRIRYSLLKRVKGNQLMFLIWFSIYFFKSFLQK